MKFGTLQTPTGLLPVGVDIRQSPPRFIDLCAGDVKLSRSLSGILAQDGGLERAAHAYVHGLRKSLIVTGEIVSHWSEPSLIQPSPAPLWAGIALIIGKGGTLSAARVWEAIAGYSGVLKVGEIVQLGPWLTTVDEILEPQSLSYELRVDESVLSCGDLRAFTEGGFAEQLAAFSAVTPLISGQAVLLSPLLEASQPSIGSTIHFQAGPLGELSHRAVGAFVP